MPLYRTRPDVSLDDLVAAIEARGEKILTVGLAVPPGDEWVIVTAPKPYDGNYRVDIETRSA